MAFFVGNPPQQMQIFTGTVDVDLLILRPTLLAPPPHGSDRFKDLIKDSAVEFEPRVGLAHKKLRQ
jgi:hypothetical protein